MPISWTSGSFEQQPRNLTNPGYGADSIRTGKTATRERGEVEHFWGDNESLGTYGRHIEGQAKAFIADANSLSRLNRLVTARETGQIELDFNVRSPIPEINGVDVTGDRLKNLIISAYDENDTKVTIFDPALYVAKDLDQTITAKLTFTGHLTVPTVTATEEIGLAITGDDVDAPVRYSKVRDEVNTAFYWNIYDLNETLNVGHFGVSGSNLDISISANVITANAVYGAVWG